MEYVCPYCGSNEDVILRINITVSAAVDEDGELELLDENMGDILDRVYKPLAVYGECYACKKKFDVDMVKGEIERFVPREECSK